MEEHGAQSRDLRNPKGTKRFETRVRVSVLSRIPSYQGAFIAEKMREKVCESTKIKNPRERKREREERDVWISRKSLGL